MSYDELLATAAASALAPMIPDQEAARKQKPEQAFWYELINETEAADFIGLTPRTMQGYRYRGRGPPFVRLSARCVKYRRIDLLRWAESHLRTSTSDTGRAA